jgi:hypothetical protein
MARIRSRLLAAAGLSAWLAVAGCATSNTSPTVASKGETPGLGTWESDQQEGTPLFKLLGLHARPAEVERQLSEQQEQIDRLQQQLQRQGTAPGQRPTGALAKKLGLVLTAQASSELQLTLEQALAAAQSDYPVVVVGANELAQQLTAHGCQSSAIEACAGRLASYPGVQHVVLINRLETKQNLLRATLQLHDTALGTSRPPVSVELTAAEGQSAALRSLADKIMTETLAAARTTPWSTRAFNRSGDEIFLAAGQRSGLKPGMVLTVHAPGRTIPSPTGGIAGWMPGAKKGAIKVTGLFGDDYAVAELIEGEPPAPTDPLLIAGE